MRGDQQQSLRILFEQASRRSKDERPAFVASSCGSDPVLRAHLKALLEAHDRSGGHFDDLAASVFPEEHLNDDRIGSRVLHYRIEERLGSGGMGVVYRAFDERLQRQVALKFLPLHLTADAEARQRLIREARAASALDHPNIGTIHDVAQTPEGQHFIAMTLYDGETLEHHIKRAPIPLDEAVSYAVQIAQGLRAAHGAGVIHRDIKPANVLLAGEGLAKIVDFGLAKSEGATITRMGTMLGTVAYMSPEQARGESLDSRTDLWSLGVVLFEMLSGTRPFQADYEQALIYQILHEEPAKLAELRAGVPTGLQNIASKLLAKDPDQRYATADDVITDLQSLRPSSSPTESNNRIVPFSILAIAGLLLALFGLHSSGLTPWIGAALAPDAPRIAVLPFQNLGDAADDYFAAGITEEITSRLATINALRVISSTSAMQYQGSNKSSRQIGRELGVEYLVTGTIRWDHSAGGDRVRVIPKLIQISDDRQLWSNGYERKMTDIFAVQSDLARAVIAEIDVSLTGVERASIDVRPTENMDAYQAYLMGLHYHRTNDTRDAVAMFERAVELDSDFLLPYIYLTWNYSRMYSFNSIPEDRAKSEEALERARSIAADHPQVALADGMYALHTNEYEEALRYFTGAIEGLPNDPNALYGAARVHLQRKDIDEALRLLDRAIALDPRSLRMVLSRCEFNMLRRHYVQAEGDCAAAIEVAPEENGPYHMLALAHLFRGDLKGAREVLRVMPSPYENSWPLIETALAERRFDDVLATIDSVNVPLIGGALYKFPPSYFRGFALERLGRAAEARAAYDEARSTMWDLLFDKPDVDHYFTSLGVIYADLGMNDLAVSAAETGVDKNQLKDDLFFGSMQPMKLAYVYMRTGEVQKAIDQLDRLLSEPGWISVPWIRLDPRWDPLRDNPRFQSMIARHEPKVQY